LIGLSLAVVWGLPHRRAAARVGAAAVIALFAAASVRQAGFWRDQETLYRHTLAVTSGNWVIESNLGAALIERGRYAEAEELLRASVRAQPGYSRLHNHLGVARAALGRLAEAETDYRNALALSPSFFDARYNLAGALVRQGRIAEAEATYRDALAIRPESVEAHFNLGNLLAGAGNTNEAIAQYRQALQFAPDAADVLNNLAWAILADPATSGRMGGEAVTRARRACELTGNRDPLYLDTLATAYAAVGDYAQAREVSARALAEARERKDVKLEQEILSRRDLLLATKPPAGQSGPGRAAANPLLR
jgi:tetratricopeptide (TPR) repeat protein